ncbi:MAG TPA: alkaline phosphatase family protein [Anaerolineales bacterium]|nr:alkaline phosphatase family protein [Anaerolineales bacterium]
MYRFSVWSLLLVLLSACATSAPPTLVLTPINSTTSTQTAAPPTATLFPTASQPATATPLVPNFQYVVIIMFENKEFGSVIGNPQMPNFNRLAVEHTLLTQYYAIQHPSLPNYIALMGGDTFGINTNCNNCFINATSLPDLIEASGRTWKTYQEDMPEPCFMGSTLLYAQKHNPFVYFDPIRLNPERCTRSVVPLTDLQTDIAANSLPNFMFIKPNICNDSHDCSLRVSDAWLMNLLGYLIPALDATGQSYFVAMLWEEGQGSHTCCGLPEPGGGRVPIVIQSPQAKNGFEDPTPYTHYSLLKTISEAWGLQYLGHAAEENHALIIAPWK